MEEKESSKEKLIVNNKQVRNNFVSEEQIIEKSPEEKILCCCINYDLTISEYKSFNILKKKVISSYNPQNEEHEKLLQELLNKAKNILNNNNNNISEITQITTNENSIDNKEDEKIWRKIGFQTGQPRNDFRAGGIYSLELMLYFINKYEKDFFSFSFSIFISLINFKEFF